MRRPTHSHLAALAALVLLSGQAACNDDGLSAGGDDAGVPARYHPIEYGAPEVHGTALRQLKEDCRTCHGTDLAGTTMAPSCDLCHTPSSKGAWRTQCTYCHGGAENMTGAPPKNLDGSEGLDTAKFAPHDAHVMSSLTQSIACTQCHVKATDVLSPGHVFDQTPGVAEVDFAAGKSKMSTWDRASGTCANNYCHGAGRLDTGTATVTSGAQTCTSCHPGPASDPAAFVAMSGAHRVHVVTMNGGPIGCADCHQGTTRDGTTVIPASPNLHIDGRKQVLFSAGAAGITWDAATQTCTGTCHGYSHDAPMPRVWLNNGRFHPDGWVGALGQAQPHGTDLVLGRLDCRGCHGGAALDGLAGSQAQTCDQCHAQNGRPAWRTDCTFCHGTAGGSGAPPRDLAALKGSASQSFVSHTAHLAGRVSAPYACDQCHVTPGGSDPVQAMAHVFPSDGVAEVTLAGSVRPAGTAPGTYSAGTCSSTYCHGNGRVNGSYTDGNASPTCGTCHPAKDSPPSAFLTMSGVHGTHLRSVFTSGGMAANIGCGDCHNGTTTDGTAIANKAQHIDTVAQVAFASRAASLTFDGAAKTCTGTCHGWPHAATPWTGGAGHHPAGYGEPAAHGRDFLQQKEDCRACHGTTLAGSSTAPSCDTCHTPGTPGAWRTQCTFCHGGTDNLTGAPPTYLDQSATGMSAKFTRHTAHVGSRLMATVDCVQCHVKATDVLSPGHAFDTTPGVVETDFGAGRSKQSMWNRDAGTCATNYCHGSGKGDDGTVSATAGAQSCTSCHPGPGSSATALATLSGTHAFHLATALGGAVTCKECHDRTTKDNATIVQAPNVHINGMRDIAITAAGFNYDATNATCTGSCHGFQHSGFTWQGGGAYHPAGWVAPLGQQQPHGTDFVLGRQDCRACHGSDLRTLRGGQAQTCDQCHANNGHAGWRSECTFCHGTAGGTGAPPRDVGAAKGTTSASFTAHTVHLAGRMSATWDCTQCHVKPGGADAVFASNHVFPTDAIAEVTLAGSVRPGGTAAGSYAAGTCSNLWCHGNGRANNGTYSNGNAAVTCASCHPGMNSGATAWNTMSGLHRDHHLEKGYTCGECHAAVTSDGTQIVNKALHLNAAKDVAFQAAGFTYVAGRCSGTCHGKGHSNFPW